MAHSNNHPFEAGWYRIALLIWYVLFDFKNASNSELMKLEPLSAASTSKIPKVAKVLFILSTVAINFEWTSIRIRHLPRRGHHNLHGFWFMNDLTICL